MAYRDIWATCQQCGREFVFRIEEQRQLEREGKPVEPPAFCPEHRAPAERFAPPEAREYRAPAGQADADRSGRGGRFGRDDRDSRGSRPPERRPEREPREKVRGPALGYGPHEGQVKWYSREKGFGFIAHSSGQEVFFHHSGIVPGESEDFAEGTRVTFVVEETEKGPQAVEVARMEGDEGSA